MARPKAEPLQGLSDDADRATGWVDIEYVGRAL